MKFAHLLTFAAITLAGCTGLEPDKAGFSGFDEYFFLGDWKEVKTKEIITVGGKDLASGLEISVKGLLTKKDRIKVHGEKIEFKLPDGEEYKLELSTADVLQTMAGDIRAVTGETRKVTYKKLLYRGRKTVN